MKKLLIFIFSVSLLPMILCADIQQEKENYIRQQYSSNYAELERRNAETRERLEEITRNHQARVEALNQEKIDWINDTLGDPEGWNKLKTLCASKNIQEKSTENATLQEVCLKVKNILSLSVSKTPASYNVQHYIKEERNFSSQYPALIPILNYIMY